MTIYSDGPVKLSRGYHTLTVTSSEIRIERTAIGHLLDWLERALLWILPYIPIEKMAKKSVDKRRKVE